MIIFYKYNRFPAKVFSGDVGSFTIGGALAVIAIMGGLEVVTIVVAMPFVINAFQILSSVRGFVEGRTIKERPSIVQPDGKIAASKGVKAPLTLMRLTMAKGPLKENEIARHFLVLTLFCGVLAIITMILTYYVYFIPPNLP
jgi:UDP-N-acetylmuramyl pentapeptide phosphotransferase/UDP-N-acetylglucosamine-1-phosphate transferase